MIVIVAGMHRSGTSALAGMLHENGVIMGEHGDFYPPPMKENPKGFFENRRFRVVNDQILRENNYNVKKFSPKLPSLENGVSANCFRQMCHAISHYQEKRDTWGWKDPRTCITLHYWLAAIRYVNHGLIKDTKILVSYRDPEKIAESMKRRGNKELGNGQFKKLARNHYSIVLEAMAKHENLSVPMMMIEFDDLIKKTDHIASEISGFLGMKIENKNFVDPKISKGTPLKTGGPERRITLETDNSMHTI